MTTKSESAPATEEYGYDEIEAYKFEVRLDGPAGEVVFRGTMTGKDKEAGMLVRLSRCLLPGVNFYFYTEPVL